MKRSKAYKWQRRRREERLRRKRVDGLRAEIARTHFVIARLDPQGDHKAISVARKRLSTLQQRLRYINIDGV